MPRPYVHERLREDEREKDLHFVREIDDLPHFRRIVANVFSTTTTAIHYLKERRPTALRREKKEEQRDTEGHQGEGAGEKEETDGEEAEGKEREEA